MRKSIVILTLAGIAVAGVAAGIGVKIIAAPEAPEVQKNIVSSRIIMVPEAEIAPPAVAKAADTLPTQTDAAPASPESNETIVASQDEPVQTQSDLRETFAAVVASFEDATVEAATEAVAKQESEAQSSGGPDQLMPASETQDSDVQNGPEAQDLDTHNPDVQDLSVQNQETQDLKQQDLAEQPMVAAPVSNPKAPFTIQVGVFRNKFYAERKAAALEQIEYSAFVHKISGKDNDVLYLVCFGHFTTRDEALPARKAFIEKENMDAVVAFLK